MFTKHPHMVLLAHCKKKHVAGIFCLNNCWRAILTALSDTFKKGNKKTKWMQSVCFRLKLWQANTCKCFCEQHCGLRGGWGWKHSWLWAEKQVRKKAPHSVLMLNLTVARVRLRLQPWAEHLGTSSTIFCISTINLWKLFTSDSAFE